ncbi:SDR family NAD(P)-dependent oxidoreductase [Paraburkholderia silviterrae]|uniref:SDR family NAD(P)-dependent oxidoreductase n=1 Tax=Paraburkholderia silviterrae TaxID=2528715 RepID=A0A4R5M0V3_9BURK|nr:SDR family NAD(P)-dependent oxidoreductase [Paraburkholderia silviterrae]TDG18859.1 SDR family NAD(P)-dependent oxidoreductase [Paraburkholderia silviterrae]
MNQKRALVTGVGPGTGLAVVRRLAAGGYDVAMVARNADRLGEIAAAIPGVRAYPADVSNSAQFDMALDTILQEFGAPELVVHNAVGGVFGNFMQIDPVALQQNFQTNVMAFLQLARRVAPFMIDAGKGAIIASGNTSALRGKNNFAGFAPTKAAQRILAESMARELGPKGVHVAYVIIDAVIDLEWTRKARPDAPDDFFIKPSDIAEEIWHVAHQPKSAWSFNVEIRPFKEVW